MSAPSRIYVVTFTTNGVKVLVKATTPARAQAYLVKNRFAIEVCSAVDVAKYLHEDGMEIYDATAEFDDVPAPAPEGNHAAP